MTTTCSKAPNRDPDPVRALSDRIPVGKRKRPDVFPLSFAQRRLWFLDKLQPGSAAYNVPTVVRLAGPIQLDAFRKGLSAVVRRHDALRAVFLNGNDEPVQKITPPGDVRLDLVDLSQAPEISRKTEADKIISKEIRRPFDLATDLMIRATLIRLKADEHILILVTHHIASDEWCLRILFRE